MKQYKSLSKDILEELFFDENAKERLLHEKEEFEEEINKLAKEGWVVKFFNMALLKDAKVVHYYALLERETAS